MDIDYNEEVADVPIVQFTFGVEDIQMNLPERVSLSFHECL